MPPTPLSADETEHTSCAVHKARKGANINPTQRRPPGRLRSHHRLARASSAQHALKRRLKHTEDKEMGFVCMPGLPQWSCHANMPTHTCPADASAVPAFDG